MYLSLGLPLSTNKEILLHLQPMSELLTDAELLQYEKLLAEEEIYQLKEELKNYGPYTNPNYRFLHEAVTKQEYNINPDTGRPELIAGKRGVVLEGSSRCFAGSQKVITDKGSKPISEIQKGEKVLTFNEKTGQKEFRDVIKSLTFKRNKKKCYRIKLKNGSTIEVTQDHEFYVDGRWVPIKDIVHEWDKKEG